MDYGESTCQAILGQPFDPNLEAYFEDECTMFRDIIAESKTLSGYHESTLSALPTTSVSSSSSVHVVEVTIAPAATRAPATPAQTAAAPAKPPPVAAPLLSTKPSKPQQPPPQQPSSAPALLHHQHYAHHHQHPLHHNPQSSAATPAAAPHMSSTTAKTPQRKTKTPPPTTTVPAPSAASASASSRTSSLATTSSAAAASQKPAKPTPQSAAEAKKKNALRSALSAFLHLHQPHMTKNEQEALLRRYEGRDCDLWAVMEVKFGPGSVPARFLQGGEQALRGSAKVSLAPRPVREPDMDRIMRDYGLDLDVKETVLRTMTVDMLLAELLLRWNAVEPAFAAKAWALHLYTPGGGGALPGSLLVRDCMIDGCIEYAWTAAPPRQQQQPSLVAAVEPTALPLAAVAAGGSALSPVEVPEHSLQGVDWPKRQRRIQPTRVLLLDPTSVEDDD